MSPHQLFDLATELLQRGNPGKLVCMVKFKNPANRINLPLFPNKDKGREFNCYKKGDQWHFVVMSHAQTINQFENALLRAVEERHIRYPEVTINFKKAGRVHNLIAEPHRIYSAFLAQPHKAYYALVGKKPWPDTDEFKQLYDANPIVRLRAVLKYSPLTVLFGGYGSWNQLSTPPKLTGLVEAEIYGTSLDGNQVRTRRGQGGAFMPPLGIPTNKGIPLPDGMKSSKLGMNTVPQNLDDSRGAIALKDIVLEANLMLDRLCDLRLQNPEESVSLKVYMLALWLHLWWLGYFRGYSHYKGRELVAESYSFALECPPLCGQQKFADSLKDLSPETCAKFHDIALDRIVKMGLVELNPLRLEASPAWDEAVLRSREQKKKKNGEDDE